LQVYIFSFFKGRGSQINYLQELTPKTKSFLFGALGLTLLAIPYSVYLSALSRNESQEFLYLATGINLVEELVPESLVPVFVVVTFQVLAMLTYSILRIGTSTILAFLGGAFFLTSAQVALVFMSAPLWDMVTYIPLLAITLLAVLMLLIPAWSELPEAKAFYHLSSRVFVGAMIIVTGLLLVASMRGLRQILIGNRSISLNDSQFLFTLILACGLIVFSILLLFYRRRIVGALAYQRETWAMVTITAVMSAMIMVAPLINSRRSYSSSSTLLLMVLILAPLFVPLKRQLKLRAMLSLVLLGTIIVSSLGVGTVTASNAAFYVSSGWQAASQLVAGLNSSSVIMGVPFTDTHLLEFVNQQGLSPLSFLAVLGPMFILVNLNYGYIGVHYLLGGTWLYPEPPVGAAGILWDVRMFLVDSLGMVATVFGLFAIFLVLKSRRRVGLFLLVFTAMIVLIVALSRPQMHQWWFLPIFGVWTMIYCIHIALAWVRGTLKSSTFAIKIGNRAFSVSTGAFAILFRTFLVVSITGLAIFSINLFFNVFEPRVNTLMSKIQDQAQEKSLSGYQGLPWIAVKQTNPASDVGSLLPANRLYEIPKNTTLIRVNVAENCSLSGLDFVLGRGEAGTDDTTRYFVGQSPSNVAYIPVIQVGEQKISRLFIQGKFPACEPSVAVAPVVKGDEPILGWLPTSCRSAPLNTSVCPQALEEKGGTNQLFPPLNFEGYLAPDYPMTVPNGVPGQAVSSISSQVLGPPQHGYTATDIWVSEWRTTSKQDSLRVSGELLRGASIIGVEFDRPNGISSSVPTVEYAVNGSIFNRGESRIEECFAIPSGARYRLFVGAVMDVYSPSWNKIRIQEIGIGSPCGDLIINDQWLPTLS
jgi:hypothetical protein